MWETYKYQRGVQVFVVLLDELLVIILRFFAICFVELGPVILRGWRQVFFLAARGLWQCTN